MENGGHLFPSLHKKILFLKEKNPIRGIMESICEKSKAAMEVGSRFSFFCFDFSMSYEFEVLHSTQAAR